MTSLQIDDARLRFDGSDALRGINLSVASGEFVTLLGPSGCGKTTLLKAIAGFHALTSGRISIGGIDMTGVPPERRDTALCFQSYALFPHLTVGENILFGPRQKGEPRDRQATLLAETAARLSLEAQLDKRPSALSGGQQQRVALARALAIRPGVVLFDEPLSNLDAKLRDSVRLEIRQLQKRLGFTAIYVTHDQSEALAMSDRVAVLASGRVQQIGPPEDIYHHPANRFVADFVGSANILEAEIVEESGGTYRAMTTMGELAVRSPRVPRARKTYLCWRPEDARLGPDCETTSQGENVCALRVVARTFLGAITEFTLAPPAAPDLHLRVHTLGTHRATEGTLQRIRIPADRIHLLEDIAR